jgi:hypothetical protein
MHTWSRQAGPVTRNLSTLFDTSARPAARERLWRRPNPSRRCDRRPSQFAQVPGQLRFDGPQLHGVERPHQNALAGSRRS